MKIRLTVLAAPAAGPLLAVSGSVMVTTVMVITVAMMVIVVIIMIIIPHLRIITPNPPNHNRWVALLALSWQSSSSSSVAAAASSSCLATTAVLVISTYLDLLVRSGPFQYEYLDHSGTMEIMVSFGKSGAPAAVLAVICPCLALGGGGKGRREEEDVEEGGHGEEIQVA